MLYFKLRKPIVGMEDVSTGLHIVQIDAGECLSVVDDCKCSEGCVPAKLHERNITVYMEDLRVQAQRVESN